MAMMGVQFLAGSAAKAQNVLLNPGFESPDASAGDVAGTANWNSFNFTFTTRSVTPHGGLQTLKAFGPFFQFGGSGVNQSSPATPGQAWTASAWFRDDSSDPMQGANFAVLQLQFLDAGNNVLTTTESPHFTTANPINTWTLESAASVAPPNTTAAQITLVHVQVNNPVTGGSVFWDDASLGLVPEPTSIGAIAGLGALTTLRRRR
jgi:hypothetical protein